LIYDLNQGAHPLKLRLSAGETMQRPRTDDMIASGTATLGGPGSCANIQSTASAPVNAKSVCWSQSAGNPRLKPWRATGLDLSIEKYFGGATYLAVAAFYKHLNTFITTSVEQLNSSVFDQYNALAVQNGYNVYPYFFSTQPVNASGGDVWGGEVSGAIDFGRLTHALAGFGATASYAYTGSHAPSEVVGADGSVATVGVPGASTELPGLSKNVVEVTAYYDRNGIQARVNYHYRSGFIGEVGAAFGNIGNTYILNDQQMDAQIGYTFQSGSRLSGLNITAQVQNLLDSPYRDAQNNNGLPGASLANGQPLPQVYERYGRIFMLGLGYKF
jgi:iron complex outermembrane recepter protein